MPSPHTQRLDVEDDDAREARLRQLLQRIDNSTASPLAPSSNNNNNGNNISTPSGPPSFDFGVRQTHAVQPPTELIARLEEFLPQMEAANADVERRMRAGSESVDIEETGEDESSYIEMSLGLGVFDLRRQDPGQSQSQSTRTSTSTSTSTSSGTSSSSSTADSISSDDDAHSDSSASAIGGTHRPTKPLPSRPPPKIVVLAQPAQSPPDNTES